MKTALAILHLSFVIALVGMGRAQELEKPQAERVALFKDKRINESSGLARSLQVPEIFWTLNDSSNEPCFYAVDREGVTQAKIRVPGAVNFDWEDMASALAEDGTPHLYIADIGDNLLVRPTVTVYEIAEPSLPKDAAKEELSAAPQVWHASYPDGRHNAETLLVHPRTRRIYVVTKSEQGHSALYVFPERIVSGQPAVLERLMDLTFPVRQKLGKRPHDACQATGGAFSPDGLRIAISTYSFIHEWRLGPDEAPEAALKKTARILEVPLTMQMEAVCYDDDGQTLWFTSERLPAPLWRLRR